MLLWRHASCPLHEVERKDKRLFISAVADILRAVSKQLSHKQPGENKIDLFTQRQTMTYHLLGEHLPTLPPPLYPTAALSTCKVCRADLL